MPSITHEVNTPFKKATFGMGCFWACDALFGGQQGVLRTRVGYSGGLALDPTYKNIDSEVLTKTDSEFEQAGTSSHIQNPSDDAKNKDDEIRQSTEQNSHATTGSSSSQKSRGDQTEVIEIDYDPNKITYEDLLELFWNNHEYGLTTRMKRQYMSLILYHDDEQKNIAEKSMKKEAQQRNEKLITEIAPACPFYPAEDYHQKYRLQRFSWIVEELDLSPELIQKSLVATRLNGYIAGVGKIDDFEKDMEYLGIPEKIASFVRIQMKENEGGNLYC